MKTYTILNDFEPWELEAYADGEEMPHVAAFLQANPAIAAQWLQEQTFYTQLQKTLYRFDCLSVDQLRDYVWEDLTSDQRLAADAHLQICPECSTELASLSEFAVTEAAEPERQSTPGWRLPNFQERVDELVEKARIVVASLVPPVSPQMAGVALRRDETDHEQNAQKMLLFEAEGTDISLMIQKNSQGVLRVMGQVFSTEPIETGVYKLTSTEDTEEPWIGEIDSLGNFTVEGLPAGDYQLVIGLTNQSVVVPDLTL